MPHPVRPISMKNIDSFFAQEYTTEGPNVRVKCRRNPYGGPSGAGLGGRPLVRGDRLIGAEEICDVPPIQR